jgi:hypothetical protein
VVPLTEGTVDQLYVTTTLRRDAAQAGSWLTELVRSARAEQLDPAAIRAAASKALDVVEQIAWHCDALPTSATPASHEQVAAGCAGSADDELAKPIVPGILAAVGG